MENTNLILADLSETARRAYYNLSHDPDRRGNSTIQEFSAELTEDLAKIAEAEHPTYISNYRKHIQLWLGSLSRCASSFITGLANFPVRRMEKRNRSADNRFDKFRQWRDRALTAIARKAEALKTPEQRTDEEWQRVKSKITHSTHVIMRIDIGEERGCSRALFVSSIAGLIQRLAQNGQFTLVDRALDLIQQFNEKATKPVITKKNSIWPLREVASAKERELEQVAASPNKEKEVNGILLVENTEIDRMQLFFEDKAHAMRYKSALRGWIWSPANGAWQRKLTNNAKSDAERIVSMPI